MDPSRRHCAFEQSHAGARSHIEASMVARVRETQRNTQVEPHPDLNLQPVAVSLSHELYDSRTQTRSESSKS